MIEFVEELTPDPRRFVEATLNGSDGVVISVIGPGIGSQALFEFRPDGTVNFLRLDPLKAGKLGIKIDDRGFIQTGFQG